MTDQYPDPRVGFLHELGKAIQDLEDMRLGVGKHAGHSRTQVGRCIHCSCGDRAQSFLPKKKKGGTAS